MVKALDVYFDEKLVGQLMQDKHGDLGFSYSLTWLHDPKVVAISYSLPLQEEKFTRKQCTAFFEGILPEEHQRKLIAKTLGISAENDFSMLDKIGGECAGALTFVTAGEPLNKSSSWYMALSDEELVKRLNKLHARPLLAGEEGYRLSLAGVQDKIAVYVEDNKLFLGMNNAPSSHILKPAQGVYDDIIFNELFCLKLAKQIGLSVAEAEIRKVNTIHYLLVKRYDRILVEYHDTDKHIQRIHQEDFCQALHIVSKKKYQNEQGPSLKQSFELIRHYSTIPVIALQKMLDAVIFNFLIGNCDAHGKNFSLLYDDGIKLAPLYDLVCTIAYDELDKNMAMKLGGEYKINKIRPMHFDQMADECQLSKPAVRRRLLHICDLILTSLFKIEINHQIQETVSNIIKNRCESFSRLISGG